MTDNSTLLLMLTQDDLAYINPLKVQLGTRNAKVITANPTTGAEITTLCRARGYKYVITTNPTVLEKLTYADFGGIKQSIAKWAGSLLERDGIVFLFLQPLRQFYTVSYGHFIAKRFLSKILSPEEWVRTPEFYWEKLTIENAEEWVQKFKSAVLMSVDIETKNYVDSKGNTYVLIRCVGYTGLWADGTIYTVVAPISEAPIDELTYWLQMVRAFNTIRCPKIFQNGLYDTAHFVTYGIPCTDYFFDTQSLFHSWYSELPKRLDFIAAFTVHNIWYWKDLGSKDIFKYNAMDCWATMCSFLQLIKEMPDWATRNYLMKFPKWVPCLACNLEGIKINLVERRRLITQQKEITENVRKRMGIWFNAPTFNPGSWQQVLKIMHFYGGTEFTSTGEKELKKWMFKHPLNQLFGEQIIKYREGIKLLSNYLRPEEDADKDDTPLLNHGKQFYSINPDGTDTVRMACREGYNWTGQQIQNIPDDDPSIGYVGVKRMMIPDSDDWIFGEADGEQAEARCVAYLSGDENLIATVESDKDYHKLNASLFFGMPYDQVSKPIRTLSKRTNHGANYNMGWQVLLDTMGTKNVIEAKRLLQLPAFYTLRMVCEHLLSSFDKTYPIVRGKNYDYIKQCVEHTRKLIGPTGWTRYCFGHPSKNKLDLNAYAAHNPQSLSATIINEGLERTYWQVAKPNHRNFRLKAPVHDSIFFMFRRGFEHLATEVQKCMEIPVKVKDIKGIERTFMIPIALKIGNTTDRRSWSSLGG